MDEIVAMFKQHGNNIGAIESLLANQGHTIISEVYADHIMMNELSLKQRQMVFSNRILIILALKKVF